MDEGRKRTLLIAASILASRRLAQLDGKNRTEYALAYKTCIENAIVDAENLPPNGLSLARTQRPRLLDQFILSFRAQRACPLLEGNLHLARSAPT